MRGARWRLIRLRRFDTCRLHRPGSSALPHWKGTYNNPCLQQIPSGVHGGARSVFTVSSRGDDNFAKTLREQEFNAILKRAPHGIDSLARLAFESDLGHVNDRGSRLADLPVNRQDLDLWLVLLEYRILKHGHQGIRDVLKGMSFRGPSVKLLEYDDSADRIWDITLAAAVENPEILYMLCDPVEGIGRSRPTLFVDVISALLKAEKPQLARNIATSLRTSHFRGRKDVIALFDLVLDDNNSVTLQDFCIVHHCLPFIGIYADTVPSMWRAKRPADALKLHAYLLDHHDFPPKFEHIEPLIRQLAYDGKPLQPFLLELEKIGLSFSAQCKYFYAQVKAFQSGVSMEAIDLIGLEKPGVRQRKLNDQFVARVLATHALSFEFALKSLKFFGLVEIGPLAVRELGASADSLDEVKFRFQLLEKLEIDTGSSNFVTVVKNLCRENSQVLLKAVLECDQHHDVFEDRETQRRLLSEYYYKKDWAQVNRTLAVLNRGRTGPAAQKAAQQMLLKSAVILRDWRGVLVHLNGMLRQGNDAVPGHSPTSAQINSDFIVDMILAKGRQHEPSSRVYLDRMQYLIGLLQDMEFSSIPVGPKHWRMVLFKLGEMSWFDQLEATCLWLASFYRGRHQSVHPAPAQDLSRKQACPMERLFDTKLQAAILQWSISQSTSRKARHQQMTENCRRGLRLLRTLNTSYGVPLDRESVKKLYQNRLDSLSLPVSVVEQCLEMFDETMSCATDGVQVSDHQSTTFENPFFPGSCPKHQTLLMQSSG